MDIDYIGNSAAFAHLMKNKNSSKDDISFNMNLRSYKNTTAYTAPDPWLYPAPRMFSPRNQFDSVKETLDNRNQDFKKGFKGKVTEKNAGEIMHMVRRNDQY